MPGYSKHRDLTGEKVARWTVIRKGPERYRTEYAYWCRCECGTEKYVRPAGLNNGDSKSCGCLRAEMVDGSRFVGKRYGKIVVLEKTSAQKEGKHCWLYRCRCDCGKELLLTATRFAAQRRGVMQSCGCMRGVRLEKGECGFNLVWHEYTSHCRKTGREFALTRDEFRGLTKQHCYYCGIAPSQKKNIYRAATTHGDYFYNGIDRINNALGYTVANTVACCKRCNVAKGTMSQQDFFDMVRMVAAKHEVRQQVAIQP